MNTWTIVAIIAVALVGLWFLLRHKASVTTLTSTGAAPGVDASTGQVPTAPAPPPPPAQTSELVTTAKAIINPSDSVNALLQHIPFVGHTMSATAKAASKVSALPITIASKANAAVGNALGHIPVVGKALAAPTKIVGKIGSIFGF